MKAALLIASTGLFVSPLAFGTEAAAGELPLAPEGVLGEATASAKVPEPNTLLVAGIGSLAILLFTVRRK